MLLERSFSSSRQFVVRYDGTEEETNCGSPAVASRKDGCGADNVSDVDACGAGGGSGSGAVVG